jgi:peroxiredoxin (alkyl hydroperoxide reductase subunit C)
MKTLTLLSTIALALGLGLPSLAADAPKAADEAKACPFAKEHHGDCKGKHDGHHGNHHGKGDGYNRIPLIGEDAPAFTAETTQGPINFPADYKGRWIVLFSHPADFTPVCTTEFMTFASMKEDWKALNTQLVGLSIDSTYSHIAWLRTIKEKAKYKNMSGVEVTFPVIADLKMDVARKYGMIQPAASDTKAVRAVYFIDPAGKIRALVYYPLSNGRNFDEIKRLLIAMQTSDKYGVATPADWRPGDDVIVPPPGSCGAAKERVEKAGNDYYCNDWFLCFRKGSSLK